MVRRYRMAPAWECPSYQSQCLEIPVPSLVASLDVRLAVWCAASQRRRRIVGRFRTDGNLRGRGSSTVDQESLKRDAVWKPAVRGEEGEQSAHVLTSVRNLRNGGRTQQLPSFFYRLIMERLSLSKRFEKIDSCSRSSSRLGATGSMHIGSGCLAGPAMICRAVVGLGGSGSSTIEKLLGITT